MAENKNPDWIKLKEGMTVQPTNSPRFKVIKLIDEKIIIIQPWVEYYNNWATELTMCLKDDLEQACVLDGYTVITEGGIIL